MPNADYSWSPNLYDTRASFISSLPEAELLALLKARSGERILDLGCGTGDLAVQVAATGAEVVGLDASAEMLDRARAKAPQISFVQGDGQNLAYAGEFDAILSNAALHWMTQAEQTAAGMARALKPKGRLVAEFGGQGACGRARQSIDQALRAMGEAPCTWEKWYFPTAAEYGSLLERHGFLVRMALIFDRPTRFDGEDGLATWMNLFVGDILTQLGPRSAELVRRTEEFARPYLYQDGGWMLDYVRVRVRAELR